VGFRHPQAEGLGVEAVFGSLFGLAGGQGQAEQAKVSRNRQTGFCEGRPVVLGCRLRLPLLGMDLGQVQVLGGAAWADQW
jgi:hypothetical protein